MIASEKPELYRDLARQLAALLAGEPDPIANAANTAALIYHGLPNLNWAGFYFRNGAELVLGPFQGKPACVRIPIGKGVCGTAAVRGTTVLVLDVHDFPGHIACDPESRSELVVPLIENGRVPVCSTWIARCPRVSTNRIATAASNLSRFCSFTSGNIPAAKCSAILMTAPGTGDRIRSAAEVCT